MISQPTGLMYIHTRLFIVEDVSNEYIYLQMHECYLDSNVCNGKQLWIARRKHQHRQTAGKKRQVDRNREKGEGGWSDL